jgi:hypothetical protein
MQSPIEEGAVSTMEPDEGAQPDDPQADAPRRGREDAESSDTDGSDAYDVSSGDVGRDQATDSDS